MSVVRLPVRLLPAEVGGRDRSYQVVIDGDVGAELRMAEELDAHAADWVPSRRLGLLTDENVEQLHTPRFEAALVARGFSVAKVVVPAGEASKSLSRAESVLDAWVKAGLDRGSLIVAVGGGVVGDLAGFCASVLLRGVPFVQVPTTLMAQVDSSVGGKTGVNLPSGKNLCGTFHQPRLVYADLRSLSTLSMEERMSGVAEVVKHGVIADPVLLSILEKHVADVRTGTLPLLSEMVLRSCALKARVIMADETESDPRARGGGRARLNFGHTVGHALETASAGGPRPLRHGEAVALGMLAAARVSQRLGLEGTLEARLRALLTSLSLPVDLDARLNADVMRLVEVDKKRVGTAEGKAEIRFVVVERVGISRLVALTPARLSELLLDGNIK